MNILELGKVVVVGILGNNAMQRGTKHNRLGANSSPIAESSVKAVSFKRNKTMKKRNYIISKMKEMGFSARETFYFMKKHGLDKSYEIIKDFLSGNTSVGVFFGIK